jgi:hypothetical protein
MTTQDNSSSAEELSTSKRKPKYEKQPRLSSVQALFTGRGPNPDQLYDMRVRSHDQLQSFKEAHKAKEPDFEIKTINLIVQDRPDRKKLEKFMADGWVIEQTIPRAMLRGATYILKRPKK